MALIELKQVSFSYPGFGFTLKDISLKLSEGQLLGVRGENGSGKTTLLRLIAGTLDIHSGTRSVLNCPRISLVPAELQHYVLPWYSVRRNFAFFFSNGEDTSLNHIDEIRSLLSDLFRPLPFSLNSLEKKKVWELSTGQLGIVALACALLTKPALLILDETFSNLSIRTIQSISFYLNNLVNNGTCIVFTSHNPQVIKMLSSSVFELETNTLRTVAENETII